jgi:hypothetical protein
MGKELAPQRIETTTAGTLTTTFSDTTPPLPTAPADATPQQADTVVVIPAIPLVDTTTPRSTFAETTLQQADAATHPATTARTKGPGRGHSDPSFATCLHPDGPRTSLL